MLHASVPPPAGLELTKGAIDTPRDPAGILAMPLSRPLGAADLERIALPVLLLRVAAQQSVNGTLRLEMEGLAPVEMRIAFGRPVLSKQDRSRVLQCFDQPAGTYSFEPCEEVALGRDKPGRMLSVAVEGLRSVCRAFETEAIAEALGERYDLAPRLTPQKLMAASRLGLPAMESRILQFNFDGKRSAREVVLQAGTVKRTTAQVLFLLSVFELLEFKEIDASGMSLAQELDRRAAKMDGADHFEALGLHWSATDDEVGAAHDALLEELKPGGEADEANPDACRAMRKRAKEAHSVLADDDSRHAYRREIHPSLDYEAVREFLQKKAQAMSMRADQRPVEKVRKTLRDISGRGKKKS